MSEEWRPVVGFEGLYEVSDQGRVRGVSRVVTRSDGRVFHLREEVKTPSISDNGRPYVGLWRNNEVTSVKVCVLVAAAFIGPRPAGLDVCHDNGDDEDNYATNLRYDTRSGNNRDKRRHGTDHNVNKERCPKRHLLDDPNLVPSMLKRGSRKCLACSRAQSGAKYARKMGRYFDEVAAAERHYVEIMGDRLVKA